MTTIYLAGPDVFLADAEAAGRAKKALCEQHGFIGLFPLDAELGQSRDATLSRRIYDANIAELERSDVVIANLTPFRGVSADVGTVFEVAYACARQKPVFGYTNVALGLRERVSESVGLRPFDPATHVREFASDGMVVENFDLAENLMIVEAIRAQGWDIVTRSVPPGHELTDLAAFEGCLAQLKAALGAAVAR